MGMSTVRPAPLATASRRAAWVAFVVVVVLSPFRARFVLLSRPTTAIYGDYTKAFPPTLIQAGTREIFLSHAVRQYQAIRAGGHEAILDMYEGMPHVHQTLIPNAPESRTAIARAAAFFEAHLSTR